MKSGYKLYWTKKANADLDSIFNYLENNWTDIEIKAFAGKLEKVLLTIAESPYAFPAMQIKQNIRLCVLSNQTTIYYEIKADKITILTLYDNRSNPNLINI